MNLLDAIRRAPLFAQPPLAIAINVVVYVCFLLIAFAVIADFRAYYRQNRGVVRADRSWVETGSMTGFFVIYYLAIRFQLLVVPVPAMVRMIELRTLPTNPRSTCVRLVPLLRIICARAGGASPTKNASVPPRRIRRVRALERGLVGRKVKRFYP